MADTPSPRTFHLDPFFAFRTPLLPHAEREAWSQGLQAVQVWEDGEALPSAYESDRAQLRSRLQELVSRPEIGEALFVASPDLVESLPRWIKDPDSDKGQRTEMALVRYFNRMCHRPTPFGLFAGHSMGRMGESTRLQVTGRTDYKRSTRLDFDYLGGLVAEVQKDPNLRATLTFRPNNSLYRTAGRLRYAEARMKKGNRTLHLVALTEDEYLLRVLARAANGASLEALAEVLVEPEITVEEAREFIHELIDNQVLVPDLEPATTGPEPLPGLVNALEQAETTREVADHLTRAGQLLAALDAQGLGNAPEPYLELAKGLEELPGKVERSKLWQVDLFKPAPESTLGPQFREEMEQAVELLRRLTPPRVHDSFKEFKEAFTKRYEQRWVPLTEALDPECGVGFSGTSGQSVQGAPILEGLVLGRREGGQAEGPGLKKREVWLLKRLTEMRLKHESVLELTEDDLKALSHEPKGPLPASFSMMVELRAASEEALDGGDYLAYLHGASGPSAARLLGRFCHGDPELSQEVIRHLQAEEAADPEALFAEIAHLPYGRMGNVLARPILRNYEIPYLGATGIEPERRIDIQDLHVGIRGDRVILWSKSLNKEVVPRLSSAANYSNRSTDIYRFLGSMQDQGPCNWVGWTWAGLEQEPWLPRVVHGKFVLSRAAWQVQAAQLKLLKEAKTPLDRFKAVQALRKELQLPRHTLLADGDNELPIDLDNPLAVEAMCGLVKKRGGFKLLEDFPGGTDLVAKGPEGAFTHELVLAFLSEPSASESKWENPDLEEGQVRFAPGSDWLYAKLYTGHATADQILARTLAPLVQDILAAGEADRWFFIRYSDPDPHIRLRLHGDPTALWSRVLPRLQRAMEPLVQDGWLWRFLLDSYEPETGRYGGPKNLARCEAIFQADSEATLKLLALYPGDEGTEARWRLAIRSVDEYYAAMDWPLEERLRVANQSREQYAREFGVDKGAPEHSLGDKFRPERKALETLLDPSQDETHALALGIAVLKERTERIRPLLSEMSVLQEEKALTHSLENILGSVIHMSVNRFLRSAQRMQEMVVYDFLVRIYQSRLARERKPKPDSKALATV